MLVLHKLLLAGFLALVLIPQPQVFSISQTPVSIIKTHDSILSDLPNSVRPHLVGERMRIATVGCAAWFHQDSCLAVVNLNGQAIHTYTFNAQDKTFSFLQKITNEQGAELVSPETITFYPDGTLAAVCNSKNNSINIYNVNLETHLINPKPIYSFNFPAKTAHGTRFSPSGRYLAITTILPFGSIYIYKFNKDSKQTITVSLVQTIEDKFLPLKPKSISFSHDETHVLIGYADTAKIRSNTKSLLLSYAFDASRGIIKREPLSSVLLENATAEAIDFFPQSTHFVISDQSQDKAYIHEFDNNNGLIGKKIITFNNPEAQLDFPHGVGVSSDGTLLAITNFNSDTICLYDLTSEPYAQIKQATRSMSDASLMQAARLGDRDACLKLLRSGVNVNEQDMHGKTALHHAAEKQQAYVAALLLSYGADYILSDHEGNQPLTTAYTTLEFIHAVRQNYQRLPEKNYISSIDAYPSIKPYLETLRSNGIVKISGLIAPNELKQLKADFEKFVQRLELKLKGKNGVYSHYDDEEYFKPVDDIFVTNNACKYSTQLVKFCCDPLLNMLAYHYLEKPAFIQRVQGMRYPPGGRMGMLQFQWHHDMDDKRFKIMMLLTDVGEEDQYMTYACGTHVIYHAYERFLKNSLSPEYCKEQIGNFDIFKATGKAGDIFLFDSNGMHSGNRSDGKTRDVFIIEYTADNNNIWGGTVSQETVALCCDLNTKNPFEKMLAVKKNKWDIPHTQRRKSTTWASSLLDIDTWL